MSDRPLPQLSVKEQREHTIRLLCDHYAQDRLELEDFEGRLDRAHRARTSEELDRLLQDLPAVRTTTAGAAPQASPWSRAAASVRGELRETRTLFACMGGVERSGHWTPGKRNLVVAIMGGAALDFRAVALPPGETEVSVFCMMGGADIIVPPELAVDANGIAIMGGFGHSAPPPAVAPDAPVLRIRGFCIMGGVEIEVRLPGESGKDAALRRKHERRALRTGPRRPGREE